MKNCFGSLYWTEHMYNLWPNNSTPRYIYPTEMYTHIYHMDQKTCISHKNPNWKLSKCPLTEEWVNHCDIFIDKIIIQQWKQTNYGYANYRWFSYRVNGVQKKPDMRENVFYDCTYINCRSRKKQIKGDRSHKSEWLSLTEY